MCDSAADSDASASRSLLFMIFIQATW
uniref:Uncharacterized protein n=1 Tax=Anguilla anguilla TaxID=7936 RepID=A0A0E9QFC3_ANGAN